MKKTYHGSCHCGAARFEAELDLAPEGQRSEPELPGVWWTTTFRCNCSYCSKVRLWKVFVRPKDFRVTKGEEALAEYRFPPREIAHRFCKTCGAYTFCTSSIKELGGDVVCLNLACIDDATDEELASTPITYENGRADDWSHPPAVVRHM